MYGISKQNCLKKKDYELQGDFYSDTFKYLEIRLFKCRNMTTKQDCKDSDAINKFFEDLDFSVAFVNSYFDFTDYDNPIKYFIDDSLFLQMESQRQKRANMYVMKAETQLEDQLFQLGQQNKIEFPQI